MRERSKGGAGLHLPASAAAAVLILLAAVFAAAGLSNTVYADMTGENGRTIPSALVNIPVHHEIAGDSYSGSDRFAFVLTADDADCPMPKGSAGGVRTVYTYGDEDPDFGDIVFEYPDEYCYTVSRESTDNDRIETDNETYKVTVIKLNNGTAKIVIRSLRGGKSEEIIYRDIYNAPRRKSPKTGYEDLIRESAAWLFLALFSALGLTAAVPAVRRRKREDI